MNYGFRFCQELLSVIMDVLFSLPALTKNLPLPNLETLHGRSQVHTVLTS